MTYDSTSQPWFRPIGSGRSEEPARAKDKKVAQGTSSHVEADGEARQELGSLIKQAGEAVNFLKALGHDGRLTIMCHLISGPKSVTELENLLSSRQAVVSQQLARLRLEGLVSARREGQAIFYSILDPKVTEMLALLGHLFHNSDDEPR